MINEIAPTAGNQEVAVTENQNFLNMIERLAIDPNVDPAKISAVLDIQERMICKRAEQEFNEAFQRLRGKLPIIKKGDIVEYPINKNDPNGPKKEAFKFVKWEKVQAIIDDIIASEGFDLTFDSEVHPNGSAVIAILHHVGGHIRRTSTPPIPIDSGGGKNNVQGVGSSMSYGQRYATKFALNLRFEDDDDGARGGTVFVTPEQAKIIDDMLVEAKASVIDFLKYFGISAVENLTDRDFQLARNMLSAKLKKGTV